MMISLLLMSSVAPEAMARDETAASPVPKPSCMTLVPLMATLLLAGSAPLAPMTRLPALTVVGPA